MLVRPESDSPVRIGIMRCGELGVVENLQAGGSGGGGRGAAVAGWWAMAQWVLAQRDRCFVCSALLCMLCYAVL